MKKYGQEEYLCFDDILLVPQHSTIESRKEVNLATTLGRTPRTIGMTIPLVAAPMDTVCEWEMAVALRKSGGLGIIHRYMTPDEQAIQAGFVAAHDAYAGYAIGATGDYLERAWKLLDKGATMLLVDTANGHSQYAIDAVKKLRQVFGSQMHLMAGNVSTYNGYMRLAEVGVDSVRVGIGGGSVCTTRIVSGHGMPTLASIMDIRKWVKKGDGPTIVADGGIRNSGDAAKALAAGADAVMVGSMLAGTDESPGIVIDGKYKEFRGMASREAQEDGRGFVSVVEGVATTVPYKGPLKNVLDQFTGGLGSALSYSGVHNLEEFHEEALYIHASYASTHESRPHAAK